MEHTPLGFNDLKPLLLAAEKHFLEIILRLPANKEEYFKWPLDIGFQHIQVPQIETEEDANFSIKNTFFYPKGYEVYVGLLEQQIIQIKTKMTTLKILITT